MANRFPHLTSPANIGAMALKNRMVMSPMTTAYCNEDQTPTERLIRYFEERAKGGVGLITMELITVDEVHPYMHRSMTLGADKYIEHHRRITERIHQHDAKVQPQISHTGPESVAPLFNGPQPLGPSISVAPVWGWASRELSIDELPAIAIQYGEAARRAREAGYDGIELHAAHCYNLLASFLSPLRNKRTDEYSAFKADTRSRLIHEVLYEIKSRAGNDFPVTLSISGYERAPGGRAIDDTQRLAPEFVAAGVDCFRVSGGISDSLVTMMVGRSEYGDAHNVGQAAAIKQVVDVPVMVVGRIHDPEIAETVLANGQADLIAMARPLLADPELPNKVMRGKADRIRCCISCQHCIDSMQTQDNLSCAVNPYSGREFERELLLNGSGKKIVVIGGGTAGLEAARQAATAGHQVTLIEQQKSLGGSLLLASTVHSDNERFFNWLLNEINHLPITIKTGVRASVDLLSQLQPDQVIVATGAKIQIPDLPGIGLPNILTGALMRQLISGQGAELLRLKGWQRRLVGVFAPLLQLLITPSRLRMLSRYWMPIGKRVVIVGADLAAVELAEFLAGRNRQVHLIDSAKKIAVEVGKKRRNEHMDRLDRLGVTVNTGVEPLRIESGAVVYSVNGNERRIAGNTIIVAGTPIADHSLATTLDSAGFNVHCIGDSQGLGLIANATRNATDTIYLLNQ